MERAEHVRVEVEQAPEAASLRELVEIMSQSAVGCVVVVDASERPIGIVTDRDLTCRVIAEGRDPAATRAGEIMSKPLVAVSPGDRLEQVIERMRGAGIRRTPVVRDGRLLGIVTLDDMLLTLARQLDDLGEATRREIVDARARGRRERRRAEAQESLRELGELLERAGESAREVLARELEALRERLRRLLD